jgi:hypothetical protein
MKLSRLLIAAVLLAGLSVAYYYAGKHEPADTTKKPAVEPTVKILALSEDNIVGLELRKSAGDPVVLKKNDAGKWSITAPQPLAAEQSAVTSITSAASTLTAERVVDENNTDWAPYGLAPAEVELIMSMKDGKNVKLMLGKNTPTGSAAYARVEGDSKLYTTSGTNKTILDKTWKDLRDKRLMTFESDKISRVELNAKKGAIEFGRVNASEWQILKPKPMRADGLQVEELVRKLKDATMDATISDEDAKKSATTFASAQPVATAKVTDAGGTQTLEVRKAKDDYYAKSSVVEGVHKVSKELGSGLDKSLDDFRNKKLFDFGFNEPSRVEFRDGGNTSVYEKSGDKWTSAGKTMDSSTVQAFIDKIRDLQGSKFVESGFTTAQVELTVVSNEGKRTEKVQFSPAKSGDFIAKRDSEQSLYQVDAGVIQDLRTAASGVKEPPPPAAPEAPAVKKK